MKPKPKSFDFEAESAAELDRIREMVGQQVPLSQFYVRGVRPVLMGVHGDLATLRFSNGLFCQMCRYVTWLMTWRTGVRCDRVAQAKFR